MENIDFDNNEQTFRISLNDNGDLDFIANSGDPADRATRLSISDDSGQLTVGGSGEFGRLQLKGASDDNTIFLGASDNRSVALLGGGNRSGDLQLFNPDGATISLQGELGIVTLGGGDANTDGNLFLLNDSGQPTISMEGQTGRITCVELEETSDGLFKDNVEPLSDTLDQVLALRGVRFQWKQSALVDQENSKKQQIGFIGQEVEAVCPELVTTNTEGHKSLKYSRLTAMLVEAVKEQQQLIKDQKSALGEALEKISKIEMQLEAPGT